MNGALDSVAGFPTITIVLAYVGPVLNLFLIAFLCSACPPSSPASPSL